MVHLPHCVEAEVAQTLVPPLEATVPEQIALMIGQLDDPDSQGMEDAKTVEVVLTLPQEALTGALPWIFLVLSRFGFRGKSFVTQSFLSFRDHSLVRK